MPTFLFDQIIFGPVHSRRLGVSLGVNLLPVGCKYCNYNCIYCECGWNAGGVPKGSLPSRREVRDALQRRLAAMQQAGHAPDAITFAGNGEPTIHPDFPAIIDDTVELRNRYAERSVISVLSNATMLHRPEIVAALKKTDMPALKLDSAFAATIAQINQPATRVSPDRLIAQLQTFNGQCIIQTMLLHGTYRGLPVDNTTARETAAWQQAVLSIRPRQVMLYTIARDTPVDTLRKVPGETLRAIAERIGQYGIAVQLSD